MAGENVNKRAFYEDIFAEDNEKWSWPVAGSSAKTSASGSNYTTVLSGGKGVSSDSSSSEDALGFRVDSNSQKRSFRKRQSSSASEENPQEDISSSPGASGHLPHERVLPSMYDDDARSGSPSGTYKKTDLAFMSSFHNDIDRLPGKITESGPFQTLSANKVEKSQSFERELASEKRNSRDIPSVDQNGSPKKESKSESVKKSPERSRSRRSQSDDRKYSGRSRTRSHSRTKEPHGKSSPKSNRYSHSKDRRSPSRDCHSRSRDRRSHSRDRRRHSRSRRSRSKDSRRRSRSRSREVRKRSRSRSFDRHHRGRCRDRYHRRHYSRSRSRSRDISGGRSGSSHRKPGSLPLSTSGGAMTPQMALQQTMAAMSAKAQALTGIALPKYYNPAAVNPLKYAEQVQKRKLLWQSKEKVEEQPKNSVWDKLTFAQDQDGKMTAKFRKLMGIKTDAPPTEKEVKEEEEKESVLKKQEDLFRDLDQQYEMARMTTHTQRGVGLGYSAQAFYPPVQK